MSDKTATLQKHFASILQEVGEDLNREGLIDTPLRAAKAIQELTNGYHDNLDSIINGAIFNAEMNEMIVIKDIEFFSLCEHHVLPFFGKCHIGYIPDKTILGLSKFARVVDHFARRLQIQETLTKQIAETIIDITNPKGVGVIIEAQHFCMMMRGVQKQQSKMKTSSMLGQFNKCMNTRNEFLELLKI